MAIADVMDDVDYKTINFNIEEAEFRHPLWLTESHFVYNLYRDDEGHLNCHRNAAGDPILSPRPLAKMCMNELVCEGNQISVFETDAIPADLYPKLLAEAIFQRQLQTIDFLVSTWPHSILDLQSVMPKEDLVEAQLLTIPIEGHDGITFLDCIMCGLLRQKYSSRLRTVNLSGFKQDRTLCRDICRLPLLWMPPAERDTEKIYDILSQTIDITEEKVQKYLNRIKCIYTTMDAHVPHGHQFPPITIILDCKMTLDDVPIGLALQNETPFRFACQRLWTERISDVNLPLNLLHRVLEPRDLTELEIEDRNLCTDDDNMEILLEALSLLPNIKSLSLPNTIHSNENEAAVKGLNKVLRTMTNLKKLNFPLCNLKDNLRDLLTGLQQTMTFLSLRDCRLSEADVLFLLEWPLTRGLFDLNVSRNNLRNSYQSILSLLEKLEEIRCFSLSYCCFSPAELRNIVEVASKCTNIKTLGIQSFTPLSEADSQMILKGCCLLTNLQKCLMLPECHAFLGSNDLDRFDNREKYLEFCDNILSDLKRDDIELE
ncbi:uncharacterized protein LOC134728162 [Mytilus trossulus]|uniref:uncharacterized protein LOC134728162 n=1 Tax=Mytilus trossulus TaxID=6551 RepID=UPI0030079B4A